MASNNHGVTAEDVLGRLPFAEGTVTAASKGLNTGLVESWIEEAAGQLNSILRSNEVNPNDLDEDNEQLLRSGIIAYASALALSKREFPGDQIARHWETWGSVRKTCRDMPKDLAPAFNSDVRVRNNLEGKPRSPRTFGDGNRW